MKHIVYIAALLLVSLAFAGDNKVDNFELRDVQGTSRELKEWQNEKAIVLMFIATKCPVSNAYNDRMNELYRDYHEKGVAFVGINSNKTEPMQEVKKHAQEQGFKFTVLKDEKNLIANRLGANVTPEIYVLDPDLNIVYHGRIDDSQNPDQIKSKDLRKALDQLLQDKKIQTTKTKAFGCTIKKVSE
ncbi:redoxin domain-containing protein [candidate division KSB1 bacterium]|nr:redoxin domain-containing protein [candidate division KSB1 bacterium]